MRVAMKYNAAPTACETFSYGEVEDYTVNIGGPAFNAITGTSTELTEEANIFDFDMYPNPVESTLTISVFDNREVSYKIYNLMGQTVKANKLNQSDINVANMPSGLYIFEINDGQKTITKKFIKK
jgi:bacillolysin